MQIPFNLIRYPMHTLRALLVQPFFWVLFFLSPVLNWFRVDMLAQRIVFLGHSYPFEHQYIFWIPIGFYLAVLIIAAFNTVMGRVFCGWACPHNAMTEWTRPFRAIVGREPLSPRLKRYFKAHPYTKPFWVLLSLGVALFGTYVLGGLLTSYIVSPQWILQGHLTGTAHPAVVFGQILFMLIGMFLLYCGHDFCRTCCPYGLAQSISAYQGGKFKPMEIAYRGDKVSQCKTCTVCQQVCPVDIDPRDSENLHVGQFEGCFNCGKCIDACQYLQDFRGTSGLLVFNTPQWTKKPAQEGAAL